LARRESEKTVTRPVMAQKVIMAVFVLDKHKKPLMPCSERKARLLLERRRAVVHSIEPFTIRLKDRILSESSLQPLRLKIDPGARISGMAVLEGERSLWLGELVHKANIKDKLIARRFLRRGRRFRKTRYRAARFNNRRRPEGWLPPSLEARVQQTLSAVKKLKQRLPITALSYESAKFDAQKMQNVETSGIEYEQGVLSGYEVREYLLEKWARKCAYCGVSNRPLQVEHIIPKSRGGSDMVSNLTIACNNCNQLKGDRTAKEFGHQEVHAKARASLKDSPMSYATRWKLLNKLKEAGIPLETGTAGGTKYQRVLHKLPKEHYYDALCVGASTPSQLEILQAYINVWTAKGRGSRQVCQTDKFGFPRQFRSRTKVHSGMMTGDLIRISPRKGKNAGRSWKGKGVIRADGSLYLNSEGQRINSTYRHAKLLQHGDGWDYSIKPIARPRPPAVAWNDRGKVLFSLGSYDEAVACYSKAIEIDPTFEAAWTGKGAALMSLGRHDESIVCFDNAIKIDPSYTVALNGKGWALYKKGNYEDAIRHYDIAIKIDCDDGKAWIRKSVALKNLGRYKEAYAALVKAKELGAAKL
jgi:5-methylcytosine-specific restriction endonuclease McrA